MGREFRAYTDSEDGVVHVTEWEFTVDRHVFGRQVGTFKTMDAARAALGNRITNDPNAVFVQTRK